MSIICVWKKSHLQTCVVAIFLCMFYVISEHRTCATEKSKSMRQQIQEILEHFKQDDPLGVPGLPIPDPLHVEPFQEKISGVRLKFNKTKAYNLSKFRIDHVTIDLSTMEISLGLTVPEVELKGEYTMLTLFGRPSGPFTIRLTEVYAEGKTKLEVAEENHLKASKVDVDVTVGDIDLEFQKLGYMERVFQGILNLVGSTVFNTMRKKVIRQFDQNIAEELNKALKEHLPFTFSSATAPIDVAFQHASRMAREMKYDPFVAPNQQLKANQLQLNTTGMIIYGLSKLQRGDHVLVTLRNNTLEAKVQLSTEEVTGSTKYSANLFDLWDFNGEFAFSVDYVKVLVIAAQPLNLNQKMTLKDIDLEVGRVSITPLADEGTAGSYIERLLQYSVAFISVTIRNLVACIAEEPIRQVVETAVRDLDLEKMVYDSI